MKELRNVIDRAIADSGCYGATMLTDAILRAARQWAKENGKPTMAEAEKAVEDVKILKEVVASATQKQCDAAYLNFKYEAQIQDQKRLLTEGADSIEELDGVLNGCSEYILKLLKDLAVKEFDLNEAEKNHEADRAGWIETRDRLYKDIRSEGVRAYKAEKDWQEALNRAKDAEVAKAPEKKQIWVCQHITDKTYVLTKPGNIKTWTQNIMEAAVFNSEVEAIAGTPDFMKQWTSPAAFVPNETCCKICPTPGYRPCQRLFHISGPCAHALDFDQWCSCGRLKTEHTENGRRCPI